MKANIRFDLFFVISIILIIIALFLANDEKGYIYTNKLSPKGSSLDPPIPPTSGDGSGGGGIPPQCIDECRRCNPQPDAGWIDYRYTVLRYPAQIGPPELLYSERWTSGDDSHCNDEIPALCISRDGWGGWPYSRCECTEEMWSCRRGWGSGQGWGSGH